jgi:DNA-binding transcriptional regulator YdaS (Cro superfamily)
MDKKTAITHFGSKAELARILRISKAAVSMWGEKVPALDAYRLERLSDGVVSAEDSFFNR